MDNLRITLLQDNIVADDPEANLAHFARVLEGVQTDLVILPEVFTTGFHPRARQHAAVSGGRAWQWLAAQAKQLDTVITGSLVVADGDQYLNRLLWMPPDGQASYYDKRHLFRMAGEHQRYGAGSERPVFTRKGWRILPQVCYDLRFPVWSRNRNDYDLALYVANWPAVRHHHWLSLLKARAIENLAVVAGVNRTGIDASGQHYAGGSVVYDAEGELLLDSGHLPGCHTLTLNAQALLDYRQRFPAHLDADDFTLL